MSAHTPLPFLDFLELLRGQGIPLGLREYQAAARLVGIFGGGNPEELGCALAALLATNDEQVVQISTLFGRHYAAALAAPDTQTEKTAPRISARRAIPAILLLILLAALAVFLPPFSPATHHNLPHASTSSDLGAPTGPDLGPAEELVDQQPEPPPPLPPVKEHSFRRQVVAAVALPWLLALALYALRARSHRARQARQQLHDRLDSLPGPSQYQLALRDLLPPLAAEDLEDVATLMGRLTGGETSRSVLDIAVTIERSLQQSPLIELRFAQRTSSCPLLVLVDTGPSMRIWARKVKSFIDGLQTRGVNLETFSFDHDATYVAAGLDGAPRQLGELTQRFEDSPLLVLSAGAGAASSLGELRSWAKTLKQWRRRTWIHPVNDPDRWHPALQQLPMRLWPMTRDGMLGAAYDLALDDECSLLIPLERLRRRSRVTAAHIEQMKRLVALVPYAEVGLAELLRQRFAADVPEEVLLHLVALGTDYSGTILRWPLSELSRLLRGLRREAPTAEAEIRHYLIQLLDESRPEPGSLAHLRWRLDRAMQEIYLHGPDGKQGAAAHRGLAELKALAQTELVEEVEEALARLRGPNALPIAEPIEKQIQAEVGALIRRSERGEGPELPDVRTPGVAPLRLGWPLPGWREWLAAFLLPWLLLPGIRGLGIGITKREHKIASIELVWTANDPLARQGQSEGGFLTLRGGPSGDDWILLTRPGFVEIDGKRQGFALTSEHFASVKRDGGLIVPLKKDSLGHWHRLRTPMGGGIEAVSQPLWIPGKLPPGRLMLHFKSGLTEQEIPHVPFLARHGKHAYQGTTGELLALPAGQWTISANVGEYGRVTKTDVTVQPERDSSYAFSLKDSHGMLDIVELPPAVQQNHVRLGGTQWDGQPLKVQPGSIEIALTHPYYEFKTTVEIKANEWVRYPIKATATYGLVKIHVKPPNADFKVDPSIRPVPEISRVSNQSGIIQIRARAGVLRGTILLHDYQEKVFEQYITLGKTHNRAETISLKPAPLEKNVFSMVNERDLCISIRKGDLADKQFGDRKLMFQLNDVALKNFRIQYDSFDLVFSFGSNGWFGLDLKDRSDWVSNAIFTPSHLARKNENLGSELLGITKKFSLLESRNNFTTNTQAGCWILSYVKNFVLIKNVIHDLDLVYIFDGNSDRFYVFRKDGKITGATVTEMRKSFK